MEKVIEFEDVQNLYIDLTQYTDFIGEAPNGVSYPYIDVEYEPGYTCGRCNGGCSRNTADSYSLTLYVWEPNDDETDT